MQHIQFSPTFRNKVLGRKRQLESNLHELYRKAQNSVRTLGERLGLTPPISRQPVLVPVYVRGKGHRPAVRQRPW